MYGVTGWSAGVDWITTTWPAGHEPSSLDLERAIVKMVMRATGDGTAFWPVEVWAWHGYIGHQIGRVRWGKRPDGMILQVTSDWSQLYLEEVGVTGHNVSRLDIKLDVWHDWDGDMVVSRHKDEALAGRKRINGRPYRVALVNGFGGGDTLYAGSRSSDVYVRVYNKEKESIDNERYKNAVRFECELKDEPARETLERIRRSGYSQAGIAREVAYFCGRRGVDIPVDTGNDGQIRRNATTPRPDAIRKLEWLRTQVSPSVKELMRIFDRCDILEALGLTE